MPGKWVEADNCYIGHADKITCPNNNCNLTENLTMQACIRSWHETFNGCLKNWGILRQAYRHDITEHGTVFYMCMVITQLAINNGEIFFEVVGFARQDAIFLCLKLTSDFSWCKKIRVWD